MKKFLIAATALSGLLAFAGSASAADAAVDLPYDWTGFYVGAQAGYGFGRDHIHDREVGTGDTDYSDHFNIDGFTGGIHGGYNQQINSIVFGVESDFEFADINGDNPDWPFGTNSKSGIDFQGSLRLRSGVAIDRTLVYLTGGLALGDIHSDFYDVGTHDSASDWKVGYTVGGGVEHAFSDSWSGRIEYRYTHFDQLKDVTTTSDPGWIEYDQLSEHNVSVGISYYF